MSNRALAAVVSALLLASLVVGCGSTAPSATSSATTASSATASSSAITASSSAADPTGVAAGQGFEHSYAPVRYKSGFSLAQDFVLWVTGKMAHDPSASGPPGSPLTASERHAAAQVVLAWALQLVGKGQLPATLTNGQTITAYLKANGVN